MLVIITALVKGQRRPYFVKKCPDGCDQSFSSFSWKAMEYVSKMDVPFRREKKDTRSKHVARDEEINLQ